jgi:PAS domain-containing protein
MLDFSRDFMSIALDKFRQENVKLPINSLCVAEVWYVPVYASFLQSFGIPVENHAINIVVIDEDSEVVFIEPQTCTIVQLTPEEIQSIYFVRF